MSKNYIQNPLSHPEWDPSKGDFFSDKIHEEVQNHKKNIYKKKIFIRSLIIVHILLLIVVFFFIN